MLAALAAGAACISVPFFDCIRKVEAEADCADNLEYIGSALTNYHDVHGSFPAPNLGGHSWRIRLVPFLFASHMYGEYRFDQPWDSPENQALDSRPLPMKDGGPDRPHGMPFPYRCGSKQTATSTTAFLMFVGDNAFGSPVGTRDVHDITDPLDSTLVAAEAIGHDVHWLEPRDFVVDSMSFVINDETELSVSSRHKHGPVALFADESVWRLSPQINPATLRALITIDGGEKITRSQLAAKGLLRRP